MRVLLVGDVASDEEAAAAAAWLGARYNDWAVVAPSMVAADQIDTADVVWCHWASVPARTLIPDSLLQRIRGRGGVLLTLCACELPYHAGIEPTAPEVATGKFTCAGDPLWSPAFHDWPDFPHVRGLQGWDMRRHPLFAGFVGGTFSRRLREGDSFCELGYSWPRWPLHVIAVERAYVQLHEERALAWEYAVPDRRVLCIGAHVALHSGAELQEQRDRLLMNALAHAGSPIAPGEVAFWPARRERARVPEVAVGLTAPNPDRDVSDVDRMVGSAQPVPFTLAGRRALVVGTEQAGIQDIWLHPYCVVSDGLRVTMDDRPVIATDVEIAPVDVVRRLKGSITERIIPSIDSSVVRLEYDGALSPGLRVGFRVPLRLEWPYAPTALAPLAWARRTLDDGRVLVTICGADGASVAVLLFDGASSVHVEDVDGAPDVLVSARQRQLTITIAAGDGVTSIEEALRRSHDARRARAHHLADLDANTVSMQSPDARLDASLRWAVRRLDMFVADTPEGGQSLMAGYAASRSGWSRSRPGYAWFFGRDACWSADAMLAAGMFAEVREVIRHLAATRDVTGKIYHELTTSGVCHYDAADSTPLFLRLVGRYFDWTGDRATVRDAWPAVQEAFAFCCSTDRDGDGLPENSSIGHGWIESGPLGGGVVTAYMAAVWIDALRALQPLARAMGDPSLASAAAKMCERALASVETRLRNPQDGLLALQLNHDGALNAVTTALSAVPIALGVETGHAADRTLARLTGPSFATPWGVRMLSSSDPRYNPSGYHFGAVWPLFTGWTALACYERGNASDGERLTKANAAIAWERARGAFDEVLHGETGNAAGVCPDQAWSAAMLVAPVVSGMWGVRPRDGATRLLVRPQLPHSWDHAMLSNVRVGESRVDLTLSQQPSGRGLTFTARRQHGTLAELQVELALGAVRDLRAGGDAATTVGRRVDESTPWVGWNLSLANSMATLTVEWSSP